MAYSLGCFCQQFRQLEKLLAERGAEPLPSQASFVASRFADGPWVRTAMAALGIAIQALVFGAAHFQWGAGGILAASIMGAVWGFAYLLCGRNLWVVIFAHSLAHIALVMQLYFSPPV